MEPFNTTKNLLRKTLLSAAILAGVGASAAPANAIALIGGMGGPAGYGELAMNPNDDGSSFSTDNPNGSFNLPFQINFFGSIHDTFFINNNGNITFNGPDGTYTPDAFPNSGQPRIAPFWADVDTRCGGCGAVYVNAPNSDTLIVTWNNVGYYNQNSNPTNNFQMLLRNQNGGNFDIEFRYDRLLWTTGSVSNVPAQAGFDAGDNINHFTLPGSRSAAVADLDVTSNVAVDTPGLWVFSIFEGTVPGETPDNPIMPVIVDEGFEFDFNVVLNQRVFIDPIIAVGYDYIVNSGPNIASITLPDIGDGQYELYGWGGSFFDVFIDVAVAGVEYDFGPGGIDRFRVLGIETSAMLDPEDPVAFVTELTFVGPGNVNMNMNPVTLNIPDNGQNVPEPVTLSLLGAGLAGISLMRRRAQRTQAFKLAA